MLLALAATMVSTVIGMRLFETVRQDPSATNALVWAWSICGLGLLAAAVLALLDIRALARRYRHERQKLWSDIIET